MKARVRSVAHAWRGLRVFLRTTHNAWVQIFLALAAVFLGLVFDISNIEWIFVVFSIGLVLVAEAFNTAIEIHMDLTSPETHPYARDTKDVAAAAVLLSAFTAAIAGAIIFLPKILGVI